MAEHRPDVAILDIKMPGLDGIEAAQQIAPQRGTAVVILTAFSQRDLVEQAREAGAMTYLIKPYRRDALVPAVELALARYREMEALEGQIGDLEDRLEVRKIVDRAKGRLIDDHRHERAGRLRVPPAHRHVAASHHARRGRRRAGPARCLPLLAGSPPDSLRHRDSCLSASGCRRFLVMAKVMLIDGNSLAYRAFFALPTDMATASGQITNAVFGFTSMLINLWRDHEPDQIVVAFDRPEPTFRHAKVPTYKGTRDAAPDILRQQMGLVREVLDALALPMVDAAGFEADDVIATLATAGRDRGDDVIVVTGDRDTYQLVEDPQVKVLYNMRGVSDYKLYDEAGITERTGVRPADYVQYAALRGDTSDNLPGVPGVGAKTAAKLVNERGGLDGIFASLDELTPKLRENLAAAEDAGAHQCRGDAAGARRAPRCRARRVDPWDRSTRRRCASCSTSWSSGRCTAAWPRCSATSWGPARPHDADWPPRGP